MTDVLALSSYAADRWAPAGGGEILVSAIDGAPVAAMPGIQAEIGDMLRHARQVGGPALRRMGFAARGKMLRAMAEAVIAHKDELYALSALTGATKNDSWLDIEGGAGVLFVYAAKAKGLAGGQILLEGEREPITKGAFAGQHILTPVRGAALHINAYNFPVWGMLEKLAPTLLAGVPAIVKPATVTAWPTWAAFRILIESGVVPDGALQLLLGSAEGALDLLTCEDVVAFTGSAQTAAKLRAHPRVIAETIRFGAEQDSLNASILGPDATPDSPEFDLFAKEVVREMTVKAGQKCTAIRRALVPAPLLEAAQATIAARLAKITPDDPRLETTRMGALAGTKQRDDVRRQLARLQAEATMVAQSGEGPNEGAYMPATLLRCDRPLSAEFVHSVEAFGPVATLMPYADVGEAAELARAGKGSLVMSLFSNAPQTVATLVCETAASHGRIAIIDRDSAADSTGHGSPMPHLVHGGPGRAGGGEEMGGLIGMKHYMQRTAVQGSPSVLDALANI